MKAIIKNVCLFALAIVFAFSACKPSTNKSTTPDDQGKLSQDDIKESVEKAVFPLPEPMAVYKMLQGIGATYLGEVLNPVESVENYFESNAKAVNLGIYAADLSYATVYSKRDDIDAYKKSTKKLIDQLDIKIDYKRLASAETKEKVENLDSLVSLTTEMFYDMYEYLYNESKPSFAALMANGYYVEGLYIATHISESTFDNVEMVKIIYGQSKPLEELIKLNENFADNEYIQSLQTALKKLKALYDQTDGSLNKEQFDGIKSTISAIRDTMI